MSLADVKKYLRVDGTDNDTIITAQIEAAEEYLVSQTNGTTYVFATNKLAALYICEKVKSLYFSDYENEKMLDILLQLLIDRADGVEV